MNKVLHKIFGDNVILLALSVPRTHMVKFVNILVLIRQKNRFVIVRKKLLRDILDTVIRYVTRYSLGCDVLKGHSGAELHIIFFGPS